MNIEERIKKIEKRNKKVEMDKAWEVSWLRRILIAVLTYFVIVLFFILTDLPDPFVNSLVSTLAFLLSTLTMSLFKKAFIKNHK